MKKQRAIEIVENNMESLWCYSEQHTKKQIRDAIFSFKDEMVRQLNKHDGLTRNGVEE